MASTDNNKVVQGLVAVLVLGAACAYLMTNGPTGANLTNWMEERKAVISELRQIESSFRDAEIALSEITTRVLAGIAAKFGKDSIEYAQVGGTRKRDRKRPIQKAQANSKESA